MRNNTDRFGKLYSVRELSGNPIGDGGARLFRRIKTFGNKFYVKSVVGEIRESLESDGNDPMCGMPLEVYFGRPLAGKVRWAAALEKCIKESVGNEEGFGGGVVGDFVELVWRHGESKEER